MRVQRARIAGSPYLGVFCAVGNQVGLFPQSAPRRELALFEDVLGIEAVTAAVAQSRVLGALCAVHGKNAVVSQIAQEDEVAEMAQRGIRVARVSGNLALGNLISAADGKALISPLFSKKQEKEIQDGLGVRTLRATVAGTDIVGGCVLSNVRGAALHPGAQKAEVAKIGRFLGVKTSPCTANYGDHFVANSALANDAGIVAGQNTTNVEIMRLQEILSE